MLISWQWYIWLICLAYWAADSEKWVFMNSITLQFAITSVAIETKLFQYSVCSYRSTNYLTRASYHQPSSRLHLLFCFPLLFQSSTRMTLTDPNPPSSLARTAAALHFYQPPFHSKPLLFCLPLAHLSNCHL